MKVKDMDKESRRIFEDYIEPYVQQRLKEQAKEIFEEPEIKHNIKSYVLKQLKKKYSR